ncbi:GTPase ObgE, partial [Candidatus Peregrinibacteria bacterium CG10_big_fil_rev_8_21_14_0_10_55_24]
GIIGYPSVGKSSLIARVSSARPKIADYPFTTLIPNLGVATIHQRSFTLCDVPGLIEGASEGKGLGDQFLRHIERCGILLHLLDISRALQGTEVDTAVLETDYRAIRAELNAYSPALAAKRELILLNKVDLIGNDTASVEQALQARSLPVFASISAATGFGTEALLSALLPLILQERIKRQEERESSGGELPVLKPQEQTRSMGAYRIERDEKKRIIVRGARIEQFTHMTNFESEGALRRFRDVLERIGLLKALERERKGFAAPVLIGNIRVDSYLAIE